MKNQNDGIVASQIAAFSARDITDADLSEILRIEQTTQISPWSRLLFEQALSEGYRCVLLESQKDKQIYAFSITQKILDELHIMNLAVSKSEQGRGYGHIIMDDILTYARGQALSKLFLEVRESNAAAIALYQRWGFEQLSIRKHYYSLPEKNRREHAIVMLRKLAKRGSPL